MVLKFNFDINVLSYSQYLEVGDGFVEKCHNFRRRDLVGTFNLDKVLVGTIFD